MLVALLAATAAGFADCGADDRPATSATGATGTTSERDDPDARAPITDGGDLGDHQDAVKLADAVRPTLTASPPPARNAKPAGCTASGRTASGGGRLVYSAALRWQGEPAVALGYRLTAGSLSYRLVVMSRADRPACRILVVQSF